MRGVVDDEDAVKVIDFVLRDAGFHIAQAPFLFRTFQVRIPYDDLFGAFDVQPDIRETEATFFGGFLLWTFKSDYWIDECGRATGDLHEAEAQIFVHLRRSQSQSVGFFDRLFHIFHQRADIFGDFGHLLRFGAEHRMIGAGDDWQYGHGGKYSGHE